VSVVRRSAVICVFIVFPSGRQFTTIATVWDLSLLTVVKSKFPQDEFTRSVLLERPGQE
jgi:hypothetical protein